MLEVKFYSDVQLYNENSETLKAPKSWRGIRVVPILNIKVWVNENGAGIWWNVAAMKIKPALRNYTFV